MNQKHRSYIAVILLAALAVPFITSGFRNKIKSGFSFRVETKKASSGNTYTIFHQDDLSMGVSLKRPDKNDPHILLCIPGAYTDLVTLSVDGLYIDKGKVYNRDKINHSLGGAIRIVNGQCDIFPTQKGKLLNDSLIRLIVSQKGSLFQQIQLIEKGKGAKYKDVKEFQRRAIVKLKSSGESKQPGTAVIESYEHITLEAFTRDLLELGVVDALYTDMGSWDEGWYRKGKEVETIGRIRSQTDKQCNWVIFKNN
jgi:hypothetical protein